MSCGLIAIWSAVVARDNLSIEYLENGGDEEEALKSFNVEMRKNLEERIIA